MDAHKKENLLERCSTIEMRLQVLDIHLEQGNTRVPRTIVTLLRGDTAKIRAEIESESLNQKSIP